MNRQNRTSSKTLLIMAIVAITIFPVNSYQLTQTGYHTMKSKLRVASTKQHMLQYQQEVKRRRSTSSPSASHKVASFRSRTIRRGQSNDEESNETSPVPTPYPKYLSLAILSAAVSIFFILTVTLTNGSIFANPLDQGSSSWISDPSSIGRRVQVIDADALLQDDFSKIETSVDF